MIDRTIEVERMEHVISVFGSFDQNLRLIETELNVKILDRDNLIHITGEAENVMLAEKTINGLLELAARGDLCRPGRTFRPPSGTIPRRPSVRPPCGT